MFLYIIRGMFRIATPPYFRDRRREQMGPFLVIATTFGFSLLKPDTHTMGV
jgi:hypothetical protein